MAAPLGISFLPSAENQDLGMRQGNLEGDLGQALQILSLRLPRVEGTPGITPRSNLMAPGADGMKPGAQGFNPNAALFEAVIRALLGQGAADPASFGPSSFAGSAMPGTRVIPGMQGPATRPMPVPSVPNDQHWGNHNPFPAQTTDIGSMPHMGNFNPGQQGPFPRGPFRGGSEY